MKSFRVRRPWMLAMCGGVTMALGIVAGHGGAAQAGPVPPAGIETWSQDHSSASSHPAPTPFDYPEEYSYEYGEHSYDQVDPEGKYGYSEMLNASDWDTAAAEEDPIGQIGNASNFSHERDWENAPYEFGDGTTADVREVAARVASDAQTEEAETSLAYEYGYELEAEHGYGRSEADFAYPEEYFYKYGYHHYNYADPEGMYGSSEALSAEEDRIGQLGNAANFSHERDWENALYEFGDGTTADVREVAAATSDTVDAWDAEVSAPHEYGYEMETEYDDGYTGYPYDEDGDSAVEPSEEMTADVWTDTDDDSSNGEEATSPDEADQESGSDVKEKGAQPVSDAGMDEASCGYPTDSEYSYNDYWEGHGYEYSYPQEKYGYAPQASDAETEVGPAKVDYEAEYDFDSRYEGEPGELIDYAQWKEPYAYDEAESYECYGENRSAVAPPAESGLELFAQHPNELLAAADQEVLQTLETLCEEPSGARRSVLNDYLEGLGFLAIDFAARFEDVTGMESLGLADDLPGTAAFLACFRLVEQGELGMDEAVDLLRRTLERPSVAWIEGVREIAAGAYEGRSGRQATAAAPMARAMASVLWGAWGQLQGMYSGTADRLAGCNWETWISGLQDRLAEARSVSQYEAF